MKKALIVANLAGFASFLLSDMDILKEKGYEVFFAANGSALGWADTKEKLEDRNVQFVQVDFDSKHSFTMQNLRAFFQMVSLLREEHFDVIHCHTPISGALTRIAALRHRRRGARVIYTTHGFPFNSTTDIKSWIVYRMLEDLCSRFCDAIITINREDYENAKKMHCKCVYYIHGVGVETALYQNVKIDRTAYRNQLGVMDNDVMVLSVGELSTRKNHKLVIDALAQMEDKENYVYVICGNGINGGTGNYLKKLACEKKVRLILLGFRHDVPEITFCSDVGAIPSIREGLGLAGIQSLAAGIPIVGTNVQGIRDYIEEGSTGFLCGAYDATLFSKSIKRLVMSDVNEKRRMKRKCFEMAAKFDITVSKRERKEIYEHLLQ